MLFFLCMHSSYTPSSPIGQVYPNLREFTDLATDLLLFVLINCHILYLLRRTRTYLINGPHWNILAAVTDSYLANIAYALEVRVSHCWGVIFLLGSDWLTAELIPPPNIGSLVLDSELHWKSYFPCACLPLSEEHADLFIQMNHLKIFVLTKLAVDSRQSYLDLAKVVRLNIFDFSCVFLA